MRMYIDCDGIKLNSYLDMPKGNPEDFVDKYQKPVLIVHGDQDEAVLYKVSVGFSKRYKTKYCKIRGGI